MNYKIEKIRPFWVVGKLNTIGFQTGWSVYPIKYKDKQYVVDVKLDTDSLQAESCKAVCCVYEYGEKNRLHLFGKHRRKKVFHADATCLKTDEGILNIISLTEDDFKIYLPQIMKGIFKLWEDKERQSQERAEKNAESEKWDGIVE